MWQPDNNIRPTRSFKRGLLSLPTLVSFAIAGTFLVFLVARFDIDLSATWDHFVDSNKLLLLLAFTLHYTTFLFRGARWRLLLYNVREPDQKTPGTLYFSGLILLGWFVNSITWFRLGDAYRAYIFAEDTGGSFSRTIGTVLTERVLDVVMVFILVLIATSFLLASDVGAYWLVLGLAALLLIILAAILLLMWRFHSTVVALLPGPLAEAYRRFHHGVMGSFRQLPMATALSVIVWSAEVSRLFLVAHALGFPLSVPMTIFVIVANGLLTLIPITPGGVGIVEPGITGVLRLTLSQSAAVSVAILDRAISWLSVVVFGALFFIGREIWKHRRVPGKEPLAIKENP